MQRWGVWLTSAMNASVFFPKKILYSDDKSEHKVSQKNDMNSHVKQDMSSKQFTIYLEDQGSQWTQVEKATQSHNNKKYKTK